ncbi:MAG: citrate synthase, partial [Planctomycetes bacterium]|nr:citrate synthase [Planctomycetota bacterium]
STITYIDGDRGILEYRGYPIEQLAENSTYLETAYLVIHGHLPNEAEMAEWVHNITYHTFVHEDIRKFIDGFRYDAHPMGVVMSSVAALSTFYPESRRVLDAGIRDLQTWRLIAKLPTLAAYAYRNLRGLPYVYPDNDLSFVGNFLSMLWKMGEMKYEPDPVIEKAVDVLFILHADHEQNASANAMRCVGSAQADPYMATAAAIGALAGPLHGGANEAVIRMLEEIGNIENVPAFIEGVRRGERLLMGFGHRVYKNYDPRALILKQACYDVLGQLGKKDPLLDIAIELEQIALNDAYFVDRKLYPNVDFYSGIIYKALGIPVDMFTVYFAIGRMPGWISQWLEYQADPEARITRPRQVFMGATPRPYQSVEKR